MNMTSSQEDSCHTFNTIKCLKVDLRDNIQGMDTIIAINLEVDMDTRLPYCGSDLCKTL